MSETLNPTQSHVVVCHHEDREISLTQEQREALEALLSSQHRRLVHFIRKHLRREEAIEDVLQQAHLAAFRNWARFRGESKPETWLFGIALNLVKNFRHRDTSHRFQNDEYEEQLSTLPADPSTEPEEFLMRQERMSQLQKAIDELPARMQNVVQLVLLEGFSYQDAALELDLPVGTVRSRLSRARDILRVGILAESYGQQPPCVRYPGFGA